jgi:hypothetical protein
MINNNNICKGKNASKLELGLASQKIILLLLNNLSAIYLITKAG